MKTENACLCKIADFQSAGISELSRWMMSEYSLDGGLPSTDHIPRWTVLDHAGITKCFGTLNIMDMVFPFDHTITHTRECRYDSSLAVNLISQPSGSRFQNMLQ